MESGKTKKRIWEKVVVNFRKNSSFLFFAALREKEGKTAVAKEIPKREMGMN